MSKKIWPLFLIALVLTIGFSYRTRVVAKNTNPDDESQLPQEEGTYDVPGHPNMKLRVFVYRTKDKIRGRPTPTPTITPNPDCSLSDPDSDITGAVEVWHLPAAWSYNLNLSSVPASVSPANLPTITANAFLVWNSAIGNKVIISQGSNTASNRAKFDKQHLIAWGQTSSDALAVTYIWYYPSTGETADLDTIMNNNVTWSWSDPATWGGYFCAYPTSYDAQDILTHELGHWYGADDLYTDEFTNHTMYGFGSMMETKKDTLTQGDSNAVIALY